MDQCQHQAWLYEPYGSLGLPEHMYDNIRSYYFSRLKDIGFTNIDRIDHRQHSTGQWFIVKKYLNISCMSS